MVLLDSLTTILPENESLQYIVLLLVFPAFIYAAGSAFVAATSYRLNVPIVGVDTTKWFSILRARLRYVGHGNHMILEGFREVTLSNIKFPLVRTHCKAVFRRDVSSAHSQRDSLAASAKICRGAQKSSGRHHELFSRCGRRMLIVAVHDACRKLIVQYMMGEYTTLDVECFGPAMWNVARTLLQRRLGLLAEPSYRVCSKVFAEQFTSYPGSRSLTVYISRARLKSANSSVIDWTPVVIHPKVLQMISRMTSRTLVGTKLSEDPVWHEALVGYASSIFPASVKLKVVPVPLRQIYALFLPILYKIRYHRRTAQKILYAEIKRRREERKTSTAEPKERRLDTLDWLDDVSQGVELRPRNMVKRELLLGFGAIHTTTNHTTNVIHDLATRWHEYAPELRTEIEEAIKEDGGRLRKSTFTKLSKLDSFMKESQRMNPLTIRKSSYRPHMVRC